MYSRRITRVLPLKLATIPTLLLVLGGVASAQLLTPAQQGAHPDDYLVAFRPGTPQAVRAAAAQGAGAMIRHNYQIVDAVAVRISNANALAALQRNSSVLSVIPDRAVYAFQGKGKPGGGGGTPTQVTPAGVQRVGAATATSNGSGVGVAIVDTGIDFNHADLSVAPQHYPASPGSCQDDHGHGTHAAGTVAALNNTIDVVGVAPAAKLYCVKVLDASGSGSDSEIIAGLDWIKQNALNVNPPIRVVNMSLGRDGSLDDNPLLRQAVLALYSNNIVVVVAAGNDQMKQVSQMVPATYPEVLAVASTTAMAGSNKCRFLGQGIPADTASFFTTDGAFNDATRIGVTISAPGEDQEDVSNGCFISSVGILSTKLGGGTMRMSGTSMASPHVAGVVARILQVNVTDTVEIVRGKIRGGATLVGTVPRDSSASGYTFDQQREGIVKAQ